MRCESDDLRHATLESADVRVLGAAVDSQDMGQGAGAVVNRLMRAYPLRFVKRQNREPNVE